MGKSFGIEIFNLGLIPFETIYYSKKKPHCLIEHFKRLKRSFFVLKIPFEFELDEFEKQIENFIQKSGRCSGAIRFIYWQKEFIIEQKGIKYTRELFNKGFKIYVSKVTKDSHNVLNYIKTLNMGLNQIEEQRAKKKGFNTCLFLNQKGFITEAAFANVFFRKDKTLFTPHISCGVLPGTIRKRVINVASTLGYDIKMSFLNLSDIKKMDECFITSSVAGAFPVRSIDDIEFSSREFVNSIRNVDEFRREWNQD